MRKLLRGLAAASGLLLLACVGASAPPPPTTYTLGGDLEGAPPPVPRAASRRELSLRVAPVSAAPWLMREGIYYRLVYHDPGRLAPYANARWVAPAPRMLQALLTEALDRAQGWKAVLGAGDAGAADVTLSVHLLELVQEFTAPSRSYGVLRARATLVDARRDTVLGQRTFHYRVETPTPDAAGGVHAERVESRELARDVAIWVGGADVATTQNGDRGSPP